MTNIETPRGKTTAASNVTSFAPKTQTGAEVVLLPTVPSGVVSDRQARLNRLLKKQEKLTGLELWEAVQRGKISFTRGEILQKASDPATTTEQLEELPTGYGNETHVAIMMNPSVSFQQLVYFRNTLTGVRQELALDRLLNHPDCTDEMLAWNVGLARGNYDADVLDVIANHRNASETTAAEARKGIEKLEPERTTE
jgi:hypothetical protein